MKFTVPLALTVLMFGCNSGPKQAQRSAPTAAESAGAKPADADTIKPENGIDPATVKENIGRILEGPEFDASCEGQSQVGKSELRLLNKEEFQNTLKDVLKLTTDYRGSLPQELKVLGFRNNADFAKVSDAHAAAYLEASIAIADELKGKLPSLVQCAETDGESCAQKIIATLAPRLWRRPLEETDKTLLLTAYRSGLESSQREGMSMLLSSLLLSPHFLYRSEIGKNGSLTPYELASALSYFFWGTVPDDALLAEATSGRLTQEATLVAQAERLLNDPRSKFTSQEFAKAWLQSDGIRGASKDPKLFPAFTQEIKDQMTLEAENTFDYLVRQKDSTFASLLRTDFSIGSQSLANFYKGQWDNNKIKVNGTPRKGVLTLGAVLGQLATTQETHPIKRGEFVMKNLLCHIPDPVPAGLNVQIPAADPGATTRERFAKHTSSLACKSCHRAIDGIGFGMEDYDSVGLFRETDNGKKVDSSGEVVDLDHKDVSFQGTDQLSALLAESRFAKRCYVVQWYRLLHGHIERSADVCAIRSIANEFDAGSLSLGGLLIKIVTHPSYSQRGL